MSNSKEKVLLIVDGFSSGSQLPKLMLDKGWKCIHVNSLKIPPAYYLDSFNSDDYITNIAYTDSIESILESVSPFNPIAVLPGTESGVILADKLANELGLSGNPVTSSEARRNKYLMHNALKDKHIKSMDHYLSSDYESILSWAIGGAWPVVMKPAASAGTDSVVFCETPSILHDCFKKLIGSTNQLGELNDSVLVQRFLEGQEFFINGVSGKGKHIITEVWRTDKVQVAGAGYIYDRSVLFHPEDERIKEVTDYVYQVLNALQISYGAHHSEVMMTPDGPTLIECASRLSGGLNRPAANHAVGESQLDLVSKIVSEGEQIIDQLFGTYQSGSLRAPLWQVQFISSIDGAVVANNIESLLNELQSQCWVQRAPLVGDKLVKTVDLFSSPGIIFISHADEAVLESDYQLIRQWEDENKLFVTEDKKSVERLQWS